MYKKRTPIQSILCSYIYKYEMKEGESERYIKDNDQFGNSTSQMMKVGMA